MSSSQAESGVAAPQLVWFAATDPGCRSSNQDRFGVGTGPAGTLLVVCDGLGGHRAGEVASQMARDRLLAGARAGLGPLRPFVQDLSATIAAAGRQRAAWEGMGTTLTLVQIQDRKASWLCAGDSPIYLWRRGVCRLLAEPHELGNILLREGVLRQDELAHSPLRGRLTSYLGLPQPALSEGQIELEHGDRLALMTDGVLEAGEARVQAALAGSDAELVCTELVRGVATQDNATALLAVINLAEASCSSS